MYFESKYIKMCTTPLKLFLQFCLTHSDLKKKTAQYAVFTVNLQEWHSLISFQLSTKKSDHTQIYYIPKKSLLGNCDRDSRLQDVCTVQVISPGIQQ